MIKKVGFIGLGEMGLPMAKRLVSHGFDVTVCGHVRREPIEIMKAMNAREARSHKEVAQASEVTITIVRNESETEKIILGEDGLLSGAQKGSGIIIMSTLRPSFCRRMGVSTEQKGVNILDAPVLGAPKQAQSGKQGIAVGGKKEIMELYRPVLEVMGKVIYCGDLGMGMVSKLVNNMLATINGRVVAEAITWGINNGANEEELVELIKKGSGNSWIIENYQWIKTLWTDPPPDTYYLAAKDLGYALEMARESGQSYPMLELGAELNIGPPFKIPENSKK